MKDKRRTASIDVDTAHSKYETAKGNYEDTNSKKKAAKERMNEINRQLKS